MNAQIPLSQGLMALADTGDLHLLSAHRWHAARRGRTFYAASRIGGKYVLMHRFILGAKNGSLVDHRDGNGLNNTRENLRLASATQNATNRVGHGESQFPCVRRINGKWCAFVTKGGREIYLGFHESEAAAAGVAFAAAQRVHGEFVRHLGSIPDFEGLDRAIQEKQSQIKRLTTELQILGGVSWNR